MEISRILDIIINVIKFIGKTGFSYRGNLNETAYSLENENIDQGNFLEIILLLFTINMTRFKKNIKYSGYNHRTQQKST